MGKLVYVKNNKTKAGQLGHWKEAKKIEAVTTYLSIGNLAETGRLLEIPYKTLEGWRYSDWWKELTAKIQAEGDQELDAKTSKIVDKALDQIMDRLENGDHIYDQKTGRIRRAPVKLRELNATFNTLLDKRQLLRNKPTKIVEQQNTATQLQNLANEFAKFVQKTVTQKPEMPFIEGDTVIQQEDGSYAVADKNL